MNPNRKTQKRLDAGRTMPGFNAVAVDTVALLSGVNYGTVLKVFAAVEAIALHTDLAAEDIVRTVDMPLQSPRFDGTDKTRVTQTSFMVQSIAGNPRVQYLDNILHMSGKFQTAEQ